MSRRDDRSLYRQDLLRFPWKERLAALDRHWVENTPENAAAWQSQKTEYWQCVYAACIQFGGDYTPDERSEAAMSVVQSLEHYRPEKYCLRGDGEFDSRLAAYTLGLIKLRLRTAYTAGMDSRARQESTVSLDQPVSRDDGACSAMALIPDPRSEHSSGILLQDAAAASMLSLMAQVSSFDTYQKGQRRNETRRRYYRLSFTEQAACFAQKGGFRRIAGSRSFRAADIRRAMDRNYLTFFCDALPAGSDLLQQLEKSELRCRCECFPEEADHSGRRLEWKDSGFLEAKVPIRFLADTENLAAGSGEVSRYRSEYLADARVMMNSLGYDRTILQEVK